MTEGTILIAGPTASGKSQLALALASHLDGFGGARIINADSMQVYSELQIITARPSREDESCVPHRLYGILSVRDACSVGRWRDLVLAEIAAAHHEGAVPVLVGGTGLYFRALLKGMAPVPEIPANVRSEARQRASKGQGTAGLFAELVAADPETVVGLSPSDTQRIVRAWEVLEATGTPLRVWQEHEVGPRLETPVAKVLLEPERAALNAAIDSRVAGMVDAGVLEEVAALDAMELDPSLPALRAVGVQEFCAVLRGGIALAEAVPRAQQATRRYAKRQRTWFRTQAVDWTRFPWATPAQHMERFGQEVFPFIREFLLTGPT